MIYRDRRDAGRQLAQTLTKWAGHADVVVLALPRGGVPVGFEVATALRAPLDVFIVRKLGVPGHEEYAMGALASGGIIVLNEDAVRSLHISQSTIEAAVHREHEEIVRRDRMYRDDRAPLDVRNKIVLLVDDGLATGSTMRAAVQAVRKQRPQRVIVAVPVGAASTCEELLAVADEVACPSTPEPFEAVGRWYAVFDQTTDREVCDLLAQSASRFTAVRS